MKLLQFSVSNPISVWLKIEKERKDHINPLQIAYSLLQLRSLFRTLADFIGIQYGDLLADHTRSLLKINRVSPPV